LIAAATLLAPLRFSIFLSLRLSLIISPQYFFLLPASAADAFLHAIFISSPLAPSRLATPRRAAADAAAFSLLC